MKKEGAMQMERRAQALIDLYRSLNYDTQCSKRLFLSRKEE